MHLIDLREYKATVTRRNQVTIPAEVREHLGLKPGYEVAFKIDETGKVRVLVAARTLKDVAGSVKAVDGGTHDAVEVVKEARVHRGEEIARKMDLNWE